MIKNVEEAYKVIAQTLMNHAISADWVSLFLKAPILANGCGGVITTQRRRDCEDTDLPVGFDVFEIQTAALFLRDDLLRTSGQRIWELTFTLYPDGKFKLDYDYDKPEDYEETDETISGDEAISSLQSILSHGRKAD